MKRCLMIAFLVLMISSSVLAGNQGVVGNGGFEIGVMKVNLGDLNQALEVNQYRPLNDWVLLTGGGGMGGRKDGLRFGGYGAGGVLVSTNRETLDQAKLDFGFGGFVCEKGFYVEDGTDLAFGGMIGGGGADLTLLDRSTNTEQEYSKGFLALEPRVNLHHQLTETMGIEFNAGYLITLDFKNEWVIGEEIVRGPFHNFGGPRAGVRFTFGF